MSKGDAAETALAKAQKQLEEHLEKRGDSFQCPLCGDNDWFVIGISDLPLYEQPEYSTKHPVIPMMVVSCGGCSRLEFLSRGTVGRLP